MDTNYVTTDAEKIYALGLQAKVLPPEFATPALPGDELMSDSESDVDSELDSDSDSDDGEETRRSSKGKRSGGSGGGGSSRSSSAGGDDEDEDGSAAVEIDWDGLASRLTCLAVPLGQYGQVVSLEGNCIMYLKCLSDEQTRAVLDAAGSDGDGEDGDSPTLATLMRFDTKTSKASILAENVVGEVVMSMDGLAMSMLTFEGDGECRLLYCTAGKQPNCDDDYEEEDGGGGDPDDLEGDSEVDLERVTLRINPLERWGWVLDDAWRQFRAHFFDPNMSNVDWNAKRDLYRALLPRVSCRYEFDVLLHEMLTELRASHTDEWGGADLSNPNPHLDDDCRGDLGVDVRWDAVESGYIIDHIVVGDAWDQGRRGSFVGLLGADITEGDVIVAVNRKPFSQRWSLDDALAHTAGKEVLVAVRKREAAASSGSRGSRGSRGSSVELATSGGGGRSASKAKAGSGKEGDEGEKEEKKKKKKKNKKKKHENEFDAKSGGKKRAATSIADGVVVVVRVPVRDLETIQWARYRDWALRNQRTVDKASDGAVGYGKLDEADSRTLWGLLRPPNAVGAPQPTVSSRGCTLLLWNSPG